MRVRGARHAAPRQARARRGHRGRHPDDGRRRDPQPRAVPRDREPAGRLALDLTVEQGRGYLSAERNKRTTTIGVIPVGRDLLAGAPGVVLGRADPCRAGHQLRQAQPRDRDRRVDHAARRAGVGRRHAAQARRPRRRPVERAQGLELGEVSPTSTSPGPRPADRGARPVRAAAQLPEAGAGRHDRSARPEDRGRSARDHELRLEVARRGASRSSTSAASRCG